MGRVVRIYYVIEEKKLFVKAVEDLQTEVKIIDSGSVHS